MDLTIIIPAYNERAYLASTLDAIAAAVAHLRASSGVEVETIVVDNHSGDATASIARSKGATVNRCRASAARAMRARAPRAARCSSSSTPT